MPKKKKQTNKQSTKLFDFRLILLDCITYCFMEFKFCTLLVKDEQAFTSNALKHNCDPPPQTSRKVGIKFLNKMSFDFMKNKRKQEFYYISWW